ncbi:MAG: OmpA family protein [Syntrophaceae bacterium]|nr:OmpA family protein [Syntrophaceae bacterium]
MNTKVFEPVAEKSSEAPIPIKRTIRAHAGMPWPKDGSQTERGNEIWLLTLSDLLMLLMIFFVVLFGLTLQKQLLAKETPDPQANIAAAEQVQKTLPAPAVTPPANSAAEEMVISLERDLVLALNPDDHRQDLMIDRSQNTLTLTFPEKIVFDPGQAQLKSSSESTLHKVAAFITNHPLLVVEVQGYTDDTPIHSIQYPSNWELSADRAIQVARSLIDRGVNPAGISAKGFGEYHPIVPNRSEEERQLNRRVEIQFTVASLDPEPVT